MGWGVPVAVYTLSPQGLGFALTQNHSSVQFNNGRVEDSTVEQFIPGLTPHSELSSTSGVSIRKKEGPA
jgi:hypothetical protein